MNDATSSNVAVSFGSFGLKRMMPSCERNAPATITSPRTSRALTRIDPRIAVSAMTWCPAWSAKITTKNSGRLASDACKTPVTAGPARRPTCSIETETTQATPASASVANTNATILETPLA